MRNRLFSYSSSGMLKTFYGMVSVRSSLTTCTPICSAHRLMLREHNASVHEASYGNYNVSLEALSCIHRSFIDFQMISNEKKILLVSPPIRNEIMIKHMRIGVHILRINYLSQFLFSAIFCQPFLLIQKEILSDVCRRKARKFNFMFLQSPSNATNMVQQWRDGVSFKMAEQK